MYLNIIYSIIFNREPKVNINQKIIKTAYLGLFIKRNIVRLVLGAWIETNKMDMTQVKKDVASHMGCVD